MANENACSTVLPEEFTKLKKNLSENQDMLDGLFADVDVLRSRAFHNAQNPEARFCVYFSDGVSDGMTIAEQIIRPLTQARDLEAGESLYATVRDAIELVAETSESSETQEIIESITYGDCLILIDGSDTGLIVNSKGFILRGSAEPEVERVLSGPHEGFIEGIMMNLSMVRRRLRTHQLKLKFSTLGRQSHTAICLAYMDNIVNKTILAQVEEQLSSLNLDAVLDANYVAEYLGEKSPFGVPTVGTTERPDVVAARLLEGRIAIFVDGTPVVLTLPYLFLENFQSAEDYYMGNVYGSYFRLLRIFAFFLTIAIPGIFVAIVGFHHEFLPTGLMLSFTQAQQNVPLPVAIELFIVLVLFDILRETGMRTPGHIGQALGVVGGIVVGQAAIEAYLIAAPTLIVAAFAVITILIVPKLTIAALIARYAILLASSLFGFTGFILAFSVFLIHLFNRNSFTVPSFMPLDKMGRAERKDTFIRSAWPNMTTRVHLLTDNRKRAEGSGEDAT